MLRAIPLSTEDPRATQTRAVSSLLRRAAAVFLVAHAVAHLVGFLGASRLGEFRDAPYTTLVLNGALDVGDGGMRIIGIAWIVAAAAFIGAAVAVWRGRIRAAALAAIGSLVLCLAGLPAAIVGVWIDVAILVVIGTIAVMWPMGLRPALPRSHPANR